MTDPNEKLITRDPEAMLHTPEDADYAGADAPVGQESGLVEVIGGNLGSVIALPSDPLASDNPNPNYTPPGQQVTPHPQEGAADLPEGAPAEAQLDREGL